MHLFLTIEEMQKNNFRVRDEKVVAKGKGEMQTYWLEYGTAPHMSTTSGTSDQSNMMSGEMTAEK
jgi:hypothetical protein